MKYNRGLQIIGMAMTLALCFACNEPEPEQLVIRADVPATVILKDAFSVEDTFKFSIESLEATLDSIRLYEGDIMHIGLGVSEIGADLRSYNAYFIYNPNSIGTKNFEFQVQAPPYIKSHYFEVTVIGD
jgi:hypothetical protein